MSEFEDALEATLSRNRELEEQRARAEAELERAREEEEARERQRMEDLRARHAELAEAVRDLAARLKQARPDSFIVRSGWTESGEEFIVRISTRQMRPKRVLFIEVDRDDDEVLARWTSDLGGAIEIWRLREVSREMLAQLVLQVADDEAWRGDRPPPFPTG